MERGGSRRDRAADSRVFGGSFKGKPFAQPVLAREVVRYVGECVAVVVADDAYRLADAVERVRVEYQPLTPVTGPENARHTTARLHDGWSDNVALTAKGGMGDVDRGLADAEVVVTRHFTIRVWPPSRWRRAACSPITRPRATRWWCGPRTRTRTACATRWRTILGRPAERIRVMIPDTGGGFGPKGQVYPEEVIVGAAALRLGASREVGG